MIIINSLLEIVEMKERMRYTYTVYLSLIKHWQYICGLGVFEEVLNKSSTSNKHEQDHVLYKVIINSIDVRIVNELIFF